MNKTVLGIFADKSAAEDAINELEEAGFSPKDISIVMQDKASSEKLAADTGTSVADSTVTGATTGAALGGLAGLLIGVGALAIPGIGAVLVGGPLAAALGLTGAAATTVSGAATGALAGGILGALMGLGLTEDEARIYETSIQDGGILVVVPTMGSQYQIAKDILEENEASQIRTVSNQDSYADSDSDIEDITPGYTTQTTPYMHMGAKGGKTRKRIRRN